MASYIFMDEMMECSYLSAFGGRLTYRVIVRNENYGYNEFVIEKETLKIRRLFGTSLAVSLVSYFLKLYAMSCCIQLFTVICLCLAIAVLMDCRVKKESVLVMSSIGLQITTTFVSGRNICRFVESSNITGVVINEAITMHCVLCYLSLLTESPKQKVVPLFSCTMPRLEFLQHVYVILNSVILSKQNKPS